MRDERAARETWLAGMGGDLGLDRAVAELAEMPPPWLERLPFGAWLPSDVGDKLAAGAAVLLAGAPPERLLAGFPAARVVVFERRRYRARSFEAAVILHRVLAAPDPVALLAELRHALKPDGACLMVEHLAAPSMEPRAQVLARMLELGAALRQLSEPGQQDLHRVPMPDACPPAERVARLGRAAGFARAAALPMAEPLALYRLER